MHLLALFFPPIFGFGFILYFLPAIIASGCVAALLVCSMAMFQTLPFTHEEKERRKDEVHQNHQEYGNHYRAGGGSADLLRACTRGQPFVASHGGNRYAEHNTLD